MNLDAQELIFKNYYGNSNNIYNGRSKFSLILNKLIENNLIDYPNEYPYNNGECSGYYSFIAKFKNKSEKSLVTVRGTDKHLYRVQVNYRMIETNEDLANEMGYNHILICYFINHRKMFIIHNPLRINKYKNGGDVVFLSIKRIRSL